MRRASCKQAREWGQHSGVVPADQVNLVPQVSAARTVEDSELAEVHAPSGRSCLAVQRPVMANKLGGLVYTQMTSLMGGSTMTCGNMPLRCEIHELIMPPECVPQSAV